MNQDRTINDSYMTIITIFLQKITFGVYRKALAMVFA